MDGVIILDSSCSPILSSSFDRQSIPAVCVDAVAAAVARSHTTQLPVDPIIWIPGLALTTDTAPRPPRRTKRRALDEYHVDDHDEDDPDYNYNYDQDQDLSGEHIWGSKSAHSPSADTVLDGSACCNISYGSLRFLAPVSSHVDPLVPFTFLYSFIAVLQSYIGHVNQGNIKDHFDTVYQLLEEMLAAPSPLLTEPSSLKEIIQPSSLKTKVINAATAAMSAAAATYQTSTSSSSAPGPPHLSNGQTAPFTSPIPWRKQGIKYSNNEIYFDASEEIHAIVDRDGYLISGEIWGKIDCKCRLSGMPDISLKLSDTASVQDPSFHPCVRLQNWKSAKSLSFVPPDGRFTLMEYRYGSPSSTSTTSTTPSTSSTSTSGINQLGGLLCLPILLKPKITLGPLGGSFHITLVARQVQKPAENITVKFDLGKSAQNISASVSGGSLNIPPTSSLSSHHHHQFPSSSRRRKQQHSQFSNTSFHSSSQSSLASLSNNSDNFNKTNTKSTDSERLPGGTWQFDAVSHTLSWHIPSLSAAHKPAVLSGTWNTLSGTQPRPSTSITASFEATGINITGIKFDSLKVSSEISNPYKGVRPMIKNSTIDFRW